MARRDFRRVGGKRQIKLTSGMWVDAKEYREVVNNIKAINRHNRQIRKRLKDEQLYLGTTNKNRKYFDPSPSPYWSQSNELKPKKISEDFRSKNDWNSYYRSMSAYDPVERFSNYEDSYRGAVQKVFKANPKLAREIDELFDRLPPEDRALTIEVLVRTDEAFTLDYIYEENNMVPARQKAANIKAGLKRTLRKKGIRV